MNEITISIGDYIACMRRLLERQVETAADVKEVEMRGKVSGINTAVIKKWLKAEIADAAAEHGKPATKDAKLIEQTVDQVLYGESLGHDLGMLQNNTSTENVSVRNNSNLAGLTAGEGSSGEDGSPEPRTSPLQEIQGRAAE